MDNSIGNFSWFWIFNKICNDIFCNIQPKCFKIKQDCADMDLSESIIKHKSLEEILNEFDIKYEVSKEQLIQLLTNRLQYFQSYT